MNKLLDSRALALATTVILIAHLILGPIHALNPSIIDRFGSTLKFQRVEMDTNEEGTIIFSNSPNAVTDPKELSKILKVTQNGIPMNGNGFHEDDYLQSIKCPDLAKSLGSLTFTRYSHHEFNECGKLAECLYNYARDQLWNIVNDINEVQSMEIPTGKEEYLEVFRFLEPLSRKFETSDATNDIFINDLNCDPSENLDYVLASNGLVYKNRCQALQMQAILPFTEFDAFSQVDEFKFPTNRVKISKRVLLRHYLQIAIRIVKFISKYLSEQCLPSTDKRVVSQALECLGGALLEVEQKGNNSKPALILDETSFAKVKKYITQVIRATV